MCKYLWQIASSGKPPLTAVNSAVFFHQTFLTGALAWLLKELSHFHVAGWTHLSNLSTQFLPEQEELEQLGYAQVTEQAISLQSALPPSFLLFYALPSNIKSNNYLDFLISRKVSPNFGQYMYMCLLYLLLVLLSPSSSLYMLFMFSPSEVLGVIQRVFCLVIRLFLSIGSALLTGIREDVYTIDSQILWHY